MPFMDQLAFVIVVARTLPARNPLVHKLRGGSVVADDNEDRRHRDAHLLPKLVGLDVVAIERVERSLKLVWQFKRIEFAGLAAPLLRHLLADVLPQIPVDRHVFADHVVCHRHAGELHNPAFDRIHQREVADGPREQRAFGVARTAEEKWGGGKIVDSPDTDLSLERFDAIDPEPRGLIILFGLVLFLALQVLFIVGIDLFPIAMVRLVVDHDDILERHQLSAGPLQHLPFGLDRLRCIASALQQRPADLGEVHRLAPLERVEIGDDDLGLGDVAEHVRRNEFARAVVVVGIVGQQNPQAVADRDAGRHDQKAAAEQIAGRRANGIDRLPGHQHGHHGGLAAAGRHLHGDAKQFGIGLLVGALQVLPEFRVPLLAARDFGQPDDRLDGFDLAKERPDGLEIVVSPVVQQPGGRRGHVPVGWIGQIAPGRNVRTDFVDDRSRIVFLLGRREAFLVAERQLALLGLVLLFSRLRNWRDEFGPAPPLSGRLIKRLTILVQSVMPRWHKVWRV